ncbi:MAG: GTP pyrophosphokinase family protein [Clostridia bacterium]|nr:GTP pyrophosphokinase family protein [Clostridia bacterium]
MTLIKDSTVKENVSPTEEFLREYKRLTPLYLGAMKNVCTRFEILDNEFGELQGHDPIHHIESRLKSAESAYEKLYRRKIAQHPEHIVKLNDIAGVRVVCSYIEDIYTIASLFLKQPDVKFLQCKDYIKNPKSNGYRSLHLIVEIPVCLSTQQTSVPVEIQLRTISMNMWASLEHEVSYKMDVEGIEAYKAELKDCADGLFALEERMQKICNGIRSQTEILNEE